MSVLGIGSSPRSGGNTDALLDSVLAGAGEGGALTEKIVLNDLNFRPCQECGGCDKTGECVIDDDMSLIYKSVAGADHIVFATPLFFRSVSAQAKMMIDRFHCRWIAVNLLKKMPQKKGRKGVFICASADTKDGVCDDARRLAEAFFKTVGVDCFGQILCRGAENEGDVKKRGDIIKRAFDMGRDLAGLKAP